MHLIPRVDMKTHFTVFISIQRAYEVLLCVYRALGLFIQLQVKMRLDIAQTSLPVPPPLPGRVEIHT